MQDLRNIAQKKGILTDNIKKAQLKSALRESYDHTTRLRVFKLSEDHIYKQPGPVDLFFEKGETVLEDVFQESVPEGYCALRDMDGRIAYVKKTGEGIDYDQPLAVQGWKLRVSLESGMFSFTKNPKNTTATTGGAKNSGTTAAGSNKNSTTGQSSQQGSKSTPSLQPTLTPKPAAPKKKQVAHGLNFQFNTPKIRTEKLNADGSFKMPNKDKFATERQALAAKDPNQVAGTKRNRDWEDEPAATKNKKTSHAKEMNSAANKVDEDDLWKAKEASEELKRQEEGPETQEEETQQTSFTGDNNFDQIPLNSAGRPMFSGKGIKKRDSVSTSSTVAGTKRSRGEDEEEGDGRDGKKLKGSEDDVY